MLLKAGGKERWLRPRDEKIQAKGKNLDEPSGDRPFAPDSTPAHHVTDPRQGRASDVLGEPQIFIRRLCICVVRPFK